MNPRNCTSYLHIFILLPLVMLSCKHKYKSGPISDMEGEWRVISVRGYIVPDKEIEKEWKGKVQYLLNYYMDLRYYFRKDSTFYRKLERMKDGMVVDLDGKFRVDAERKEITLYYQKDSSGVIIERRLGGISTEVNHLRLDEMKSDYGFVGQTLEKVK